MEFLKILLESTPATSADVNQVLKTLIDQQLSGTIDESVACTTRPTRAIHP